MKVHDQYLVCAIHSPLYYLRHTCIVELPKHANENMSQRMEKCVALHAQP